MDQAGNFFQERQNRKNDGDEIFGKNVACSLRKIKDKNRKGYTTLKIQKFLFKARYERTRDSFQFSRDSLIPSAKPLQKPITTLLKTPQQPNSQVPYSSVCPFPQSTKY